MGIHLHMVQQNLSTFGKLQELLIKEVTYSLLPDWLQARWKRRWQIWRAP